MKVLAFEDSVDIEALLISGGVNLSDIEFKQYWNSGDFLEKIRDYAPDILLLDHYMPPFRGLSVLKMLLDSDVPEYLQDPIALLPDCGRLTDSVSKGGRYRTFPH